MTDNTARRHLTLDAEGKYEIRVAGVIEGDWTDWIAGLITIDATNEVQSVSSITAVFDQAALQGILRRLYSLGYPLISVNCISMEDPQ